MFKKGDYIIYKKDMCKIKEIKGKYYQDTDYYILEPISDASLLINIPVNNKEIRAIISKKEVEKIINKIPEIELICPANDKMIENEYKVLINSGVHEDLIRIIKTAYMRNEDRRNSGKKIGDKDNNYFNKAEKMLYNEFSIALNMTYDEAKRYVESKVTELLKK